MADYLFIRLRDHSPDVEWLALDEQGRLIEPLSRGSLELLSGHAHGRRVVVLLPGAEIVTTQAQLPKASQSRLRQLLPYTLEDAFAADIDSLHFAAGRRTTSGAVLASVVEQGRLEAWLDAIRAAGLRPHAVYAETEGVPDTPSTLSLVLEGERVYGRRPDQAAFVLEGLSLSQVVDLLATQGEDRSDLQHLIVYTESDAQLRHQAELAEIRTRVASLDVKVAADGVLARFATTLLFEPGANLLQGSYAPRSDYTGLLRPWYAAAALAAGFIAVSAGSLAAEYFALKRQDSALSDQVTTICARDFGSPRLSACRAEMQQRLAAAGQQSSLGQESFLTTLAAVSESMVAEGRIEALSYRNGVMDLQLVAPSVPLLDQFSQGVAAGGRFQVRIQSANPSDAGVEGRVQIAGAQP
jgi:general secretion pathway protein L